MTKSRYPQLLSLLYLQLIPQLLLLCILSGCRSTSSQNSHDSDELWDSYIAAVNRSSNLNFTRSEAANSVTIKYSGLPADKKSFVGSAKEGFKKGDIALTLDDGPNGKITHSILAVLKKHKVKATFYLIGCNVQKDPDTVKAIALDGHKIANHSWMHNYMDDILRGRLSVRKKCGVDATGRGAIRVRLQKTEDEIKKALGADLQGQYTGLFRFPGGESRSFASRKLTKAQKTELRNTLYENRYQNVHWNIETNDTSMPVRRIPRSWDGDCPNRKMRIKKVCEFYSDYRKKNGLENTRFDELSRQQKLEITRKATLIRALASLISNRFKGILLMHDKFSWSPWMLDHFLEELATPNLLLEMTKQARVKLPEQFRFVLQELNLEQN